MPPLEIGSSQAGAARHTGLAITAAYYLAFVVLGLTTASFGPTLPGLAEHVRATIGQISYLFVLRSLGYLSGSLIAGRLYDRVRGHPVMAAMILALAVIMAAIPVVPALWLLAALLFLLGAFESVLDVGGNTLLVWIHRERIGPYMNGLHFFFGLGAFLSPVIVALTVARTGDIYWAYWALALLMLPSAAWLARLRSPAPIASRGAAPDRPALPVLIALIALFDFLYVGAEVAFGGWVFTYATALGLGTPATAAYLTSGFWGALTAGRLASIPLAARFPPRAILLADLLIVLAGLALILALPGAFAALWAGAILVGLGMASIFPTLLNLAGDHMTITGSVTSWFFVGSSLGGMSLPWIIGQLFEPLGPQVAMLAILISTLLCLLVYAAMMAYTRSQPART